MGDGGVLYEDLIDLLWGDLLAAAIDDLLEAARQEEVAIGVEAALVARAKPAVGERAPVGRGIIFVASRDIRPADDDLADLTNGKQVAGVVHNADIRPGGDPNRPRLSG